MTTLEARTLVSPLGTFTVIYDPENPLANIVSDLTIPIEQ